MIINVATPLQDMNVEDEYFTAIENRDTAIMMRDKKIEEQGKQLAEQGKQLAEQEQMLASTINMLIAANVSIQDIAVNLNLGEEDVARIMPANRKE